METELAKLEKERSSSSIPDESIIRDYYDLRQQLTTYTEDMQFVINHPDYSKSFLQPGRLLQIKYQDHDFGWGAVVNFHERKGSRNSNENFTPQERFILDVLLPIAEGSAVGTKSVEPLPPGVRPPQKGEKIKMEVVPVLLSCVRAIAHIRLTLPKDLGSSESRSRVRKLIDEVKRRFPDGIALLDPIEDMHIKDDGFKKLLRVRNGCIS